MKYYRHVNWAYLDWAAFFGFIGRAEPVIHQLYSEPLQKFRLAARGHGKIIPPTEHRARVATYFDPIPFWYPPFEGEQVNERVEEVAKCALISMDSTIKSNLSVGLPLDLMCYERDSLKVTKHKLIDSRDEYFSSIRGRWAEQLKKVFNELPEPGYWGG